MKFDFLNNNLTRQPALEHGYGGLSSNPSPSEFFSDIIN